MPRLTLILVECNLTFWHLPSTLHTLRAGDWHSAEQGTLKQTRKGNHISVALVAVVYREVIKSSFFDVLTLRASTDSKQVLRNTLHHTMAYTQTQAHMYTRMKP